MEQDWTSPKANGRDDGKELATNGWDFWRYAVRMAHFIDEVNGIARDLVAWSKGLDLQAVVDRHFDTLTCTGQMTLYLGKDRKQEFLLRGTQSPVTVAGAK